MLVFPNDLLNLPLITSEAAYCCLILVRDHQLCICTVRELETNDYESNALAIRLAGLILND